MSTTWTITDAQGNTYTVDSVSIDAGWPEFRIGRETTLELIFDDGSHKTTYENLREFSEYLQDQSTEIGTDYREVPYYREYTHREAPLGYQSYLWKLEPDDSIQSVDSHWVLVTNMVDNTLISGSWEKLEVTLFVIAPADEGDRAFIRDKYEV